VFGELLDSEDGGRFLVGPAEPADGQQRYLPNTNILETRFDSSEGSFRVLDFAPRFLQHERSFRPTKLVRIVEPLSGTPRVRVVCEPVLGWSKKQPRREHGSHHVSFLGYDAELRLTTDIPLSYLNGHSFALTEKRHLVLAWGEPVEQALAPLCDRFLTETHRYWTRWVKHCDVPPLYQAEVIRSALALKLHCFEDTGAIVAATTTSIPEFAGSGRTWDYRYCWLRDAYYVLDAFRLLGHFEEREQFLAYLLNVASSTPSLDLAPLYRIDGGSEITEETLPHWRGYHGEGPVRIGNAAALHKQHDIFGEMVLALAPIFLDDRFHHERSSGALDLITRLARKAVSVAGSPDAGIWEYRAEWKPQTFSTLMCWAAADRACTINTRHVGGTSEVARELRTHAARIHADLLRHSWNPELASFVATRGSGELDASLLQAVKLRLLPFDDARLHGTLDAIVKHLGQDGWLFRYRMHDGLGLPEVAFVVCTFWLVEALASLGRMSEARAVLEQACSTRSPLGLLSEDIDTRTGRMWGNFPQAYSHVGLIHAAFAASPRWHEVL
jgi:GH15 family glucan-1,4-alpha-glucosidase